MLFYILTILVSMVIIIFANVLAVPFELNNLLYVTLSTAACTIGVIAVDGLGAFVVRRCLPVKWFLPSRQLFQVSKKERNFYKKIKIKSWKDKVPELGMFTAFSKSEFNPSGDKAYLERFIVESNFGVICHLQNAIFGFVILFIPFWVGGNNFIFPCHLSIWLPVFIVNFILSLLPVFILRYTTYTLNRLYEKKARLEMEKNNLL